MRAIEMMTRDISDDRGEPGRPLPGDPSAWIAYLAFQVSVQHQKLIEAGLKPLELSVAVWRPLMLLKATGPCTMTRLSRLAGVDRTTLTRIVDRLVAEGLVKREPSPTDRRLVVLSLSRKGEDAYLAGAPIEARVNGLISNGMSAEDQVKLCQFLVDALARSVADPEVLTELLFPVLPPRDPS